MLAIAAPAVGAGERVAQLVTDRVQSIDASLLADALARRASPALVDRAVGRVESSGSWHTTNILMPLIPSLAPYLSIEHVTRLCAAASSNYEIYQAHTADAEFTKLFDLTSHWDGVRQGWVDLARFQHPYQDDQRPAFPGVRSAAVEKWGAEILA